LPGLEEFEDKIDKIASNGDNGDGSWLGNLYKKFKGSFGNNDLDALNSVNDLDGLEPPVLDETWGLSDIKKLYQNSKKLITTNCAVIYVIIILIRWH